MATCIISLNLYTQTLNIYAYNYALNHISMYFKTVITCPVPEEIDNGQVHYTSVVYLSNVTYNCKEGFKLAKGNPRRMCLETKTWSGALPECIGTFDIFIFK